MRIFKSKTIIHTHSRTHVDNKDYMSDQQE